jgi:hypothetical protein
MPQTNRRATQRFESKPGNHITYGATSAALRDLSLEGIFVLDLDPFPVGSEIAFTLRAGNQDISLDGVVRRSLDQDGMGIQFTKVTPESNRRLRIHIASLVPAPSQLVMT